MRLTSADGEPVGEALHAVEPVQVWLQAVPPNAWANGCGWPTSLTLTVQQGWPSGIDTARCIYPSTIGLDEIFDAVFIVKPASNARAQVAAANVNTWNAYNDRGGYGVGGRSKYQNEVQGSFARPAPWTSPVPQGDAEQDFHPRHCTRGELWILEWLSREIAVTSTSTSTSTWASRSRLLPRAASPHAPGVLDLRHVGSSRRLPSLAVEACSTSAGTASSSAASTWTGHRALQFFGGDASAGRERDYFRNLGRPERDLLGVAYRSNNYLTAGLEHCHGRGLFNRTVSLVRALLPNRRVALADVSAQPRSSPSTVGGTRRRL